MPLFLRRKLLCWMLVVALTLQVLGAQAANAATATLAEGDNDPETLYDLVAVVMDSGLDKDEASYPGLIDEGFSDELGERKLGERVLRYAEDISENNDLTDVKILIFDQENDDVLTLASALENLYRNGDGSKNNRLAGVVLVGDIPLPVVSKNGNRFASIFPYTDFSNKAYVYDAAGGTFEVNPAVSFPKPEIWHGVIQPISDDTAGKEKLAEFFDKNHLYYEKDPAFAEFEKKLFFADLAHEEGQIFSDVYEHYEEYINSMEDLAYMRYNKFWAKELLDDAVSDLPINEDNEYNQPTADGTPGFGEQLKNGDALAFLPDVRSKNVINQFLLPYYRVLNRYISKTNDWAEYTGRYKPVTDFHSVPALIAMKDEFTKFYLRSVNDALEKKINELVAKIEEPLPLLEYAMISGKVGDEPFKFSLDDDGESDILEAGEDLLVGRDYGTNMFFRYHYYNEVADKLYVNGVEGDILESAKQCSVYLGSTRADYFDEDLDFDPKKVGGDYSILTRSMRSDATISAIPTQTAGVNTRMLPPDELEEATNGAYRGGAGLSGLYDTGAIIEDNPDYGVSAFLHNLLFSWEEGYKGPWEQRLQKGDVIVAVNGKNLNSLYTFDGAINESYEAVKAVIDAVNNRDLSQLAEFEYAVAIDNNRGLLDEAGELLGEEGGAAYDYLDTPEDIMNSGKFISAIAELDPIPYTGDPVEDATAEAEAEKVFEEGDVVVGVMSVDFYSGSQKRTETFTFSQKIGDGGSSFVSREGADGDIEMAVVLAPDGLPGGEDFDFDAETDGAIFTLYDGNTLGYGGYDNDDYGAYDQSAGCNAKSTTLNSDRCIPMLATMPVLEPAGSTAPVKTFIPGVGNVIQFPENVKRDKKQRNSDLVLHHQQNVEMFQFPSTYEFEDVDELIYDYCFRGLPALPANLTSEEHLDYNNYAFPLDPVTEDESGEEKIVFGDFYGRLLKNFGEFINDALEDSDDNEVHPRWLEFNIDPEIDPEDEGVSKEWKDQDNSDYPVYRDLLSLFSPKENLWLGMDKIDASEVVLNASGDEVTLKHFADHYGLFDGIDNNNDGIVDYEWRDEDQDDDNIYETKWYDFAEANPIYGIPSQNLGEIARKLLSHNSTYTIPYGLEGFPYDEFDEDVTLNVITQPYKGRQISSMILHNEPTAYTILQQEKSLNTASMPIDNPRYVAFVASPPVAPVNPNPPDGLNTVPHYYPGQIQKIVYPNVFRVPNMAQLQSELVRKAQEIALIPGSHKVFGEGADEEDYTALEISQKIYEDYFAPAVDNLEDLPASGFDLEAAATRKIYDALKWKDLNIDDKHEYILEFYLNGDELHDAYVNDPQSYEAAYLVMNGEEDFFEFSFNKAQPQETDLRFDPVAAYLPENAVARPAEPPPLPAVSEDEEIGFVWLTDFMEELQRFINDFENVGLKDTEFNDVKFETPVVEETVGGEPVAVEIVAESRVLVANGQSKTRLDFVLRDADGNVANNSYAQVAVFADGPVRLDEREDLSGKIQGVQLATFDGRTDVEVHAGNDAGETRIIAVLMDFELENLLAETDDISEIDFEDYPGKSLTIDVLEDVSLELSVLDADFNPAEGIAADGESIARIGVKLKDGEKTLDSYNGPIQFTVLNKNLGKFIGPPPKQMNNGILAPGNVNFGSSRQAGEAEILVEAPGFVSETVKFSTLPGTPTHIKLESSSQILPVNGEEVILKASLLDQFGNLVSSVSGRPVRFSATEASSGLLEFDPDTVLTVGGAATTILRANGNSGTINIVAESDGVEPGKISLKASKKITAEKAKDFAPKALYMSVLGGNFGEMDGENIAETLLYEGQVQAISTMTTAAKNLRLFGVDGYGKLEILSPGVETTAVAATDSFPFQKVLLSDTLNDTELAEVFIVPRPDSKLILNGEGKEGIFVNILTEDIQASEKNDEIIIEQSGDTKIRVDKFGRIFLGEDFELLIPAEISGNWKFEIAGGGKKVAEIIYRQKFERDAAVLLPNETLSSYFPGVYVTPKSLAQKYGFTPAFSGTSTKEPKGLYMVDTEADIDAAQAPDVKDRFGLGFEKDDKHMLLFAAGNSVGESNVPYSSDAGIVLGDPLIRLNVDEQAGASGYGKDVGKPIYTGDKPIKQMVDFDFNGDSYDDLLLVYEDGFVGLLENKISNQRFVDRGFVIYVANGIHSAARIDANNDGYDDLVVGTKENCNVGEECISLFINRDGNFTREPLNLALSNRKANFMKAADINADGCEDLVVSDSSGNINIFYNKNDDDECLGLETNFGFRKNFGFEVNEEESPADSIFVSYPSLSNPESVLTVGADEFTNIREVSSLAASTKKTVDVNGAPAEIGDQIDYFLTLKNDSGSNFADVKISDITSPALTLMEESLQCMDAGCGDELRWENTGMSMRSKIITGVTIPKNGSRHIKYSMRIEKMPKVDFEVGRDFVEYPSGGGDPYPDILVRPQVNKEGILTYLYSTEIGGNGYVRYEELNVDTTAPDPRTTQEEQFKKRGFPSPAAMQELTARQSADPQAAPSPALMNKLKGTAAATFSQDSDYNGCPDSWSSALSDFNTAATEAVGAAGAVANGVGKALSALRCSGGCLPNPYNQALLVPDGPLPGTPFFAQGTPNFPIFSLFWASSYIPSAYRIYISPTTTLGLGAAYCAGPSVGHASPCFAFAVPGPSAACTALIESAIDTAVAFAKDTVIDPVLGQAGIISDGSGSETSEDITFKDAFADPDDIFSAAADVNVRIPGMPSMVTNWIDRQMDEIYGKLLNFPTFYLILPDITSLALDIEDQKVIEDAGVELSQEINWQNFNDFANSLSRIPMVRIDTKEIIIKIPAISQKEIEKYKAQAEKWLEYMETELDRFTDFNCDLDDIDDARASICDKILLDIDELVRSVRNLLTVLDRIADLPRDILDWRHLEAKYASQIIAYMDAIMFFTGGYIKKQQKIAEAWIDTVKEVIRTFASWKAVLQLAIDYQASCDQCKNDRFGKLGFLLMLFMALPDLPIIPLPKWPDVVVDISNIRTGVRILWPDIVFKPEPIILPNLPTIKLPDLIPELEIKIPGFDVPQFPELILPTLPDLPPLPIPQLPDLPRPPMIPSIPDLVAEIVTNLRPVFKILCLLKNGLIPVPEAGLAAEIETLTQPGIEAILPLLKHLTVQLPPIEYDYVKEIRLNAKLAFDLDTTGILEAVQKGADAWNGGVRDLIRNLNKFLALPYGQMLSAAIETAIKKALEAGIKLGIEGVEAGAEAVEEAFGSEERESSFAPEFQDYYGIKDQYAQLNKILTDYIAEMEIDENYPEKFYLTATETLLAPTDPLLNKSLSELEKNSYLADLPDAPHLQQLAALRNELLAYAQGLHENNALLEQIEDYNSFTKILVENDKSLNRIAALSGAVLGDRKNPYQQTLEMSFLGEKIESDLLGQAKETVADQRLLALEAAEDLSAVTAGTGSGTVKTLPKGFFILADGVNENVLTYTLELGQNVQSIFNDVDQDEDTDIIYFMGSDVYLKENRTNNPDLPEGELLVGFSNNAVGDYVSAFGVEGPVVTYTGSGKADVVWQPVADATSYEMWIRKSLSDDLEETVQRLTTQQPKLSLQIENSNYYATIFAVDKNGGRSLQSDGLLIAPQTCADRQSPFAVVDDVYEVSIFKELEIDARNSFDADGEITQYYLEDTVSGRLIWSDTDVRADSNGDGNPSNDRTNPIFRIGPFNKPEDVGEHRYILHVVDQSGNSSAAEVKVNVFVPEITLDETFANSGVATGKTAPEVAQLPFSMMRERLIYRVVDDALKAVPRLDRLADRITDDAGAYRIDDFNLANILLVENAEGEIVAKIHPATGNIGVLADGYTTIVNEAIVPTEASNVEIISPSGEPMAAVYLVADSNIDVNINDPSYGVNVTDFENDSYQFVHLPANDGQHPGGAMLIDDKNKSLLIVDTAGNILILDGTVDLRQKKNDYLKDPLIIEVLVDKEVAGEIFVDPFSERAFIIGSVDLPFATPRGPSEATLYGSYPYDFDAATSTFTDSDEIVSRKEFVKMVLNMLCIVPRKEAYQPFAAGSGYSDVPYKKGEDFAFIKEATLRGLVEGYKGETDAQGLLPFKPENSISRAEAVKIILEAMELQGLVSLGGMEEGTPWYEPFMSLAQDLDGGFIITSEEAKNPDEELKYGILVEMAQRVLNINDCVRIDKDNDGMSDYCEAKYEIDDPVLDEDNDGLINKDECYYGLDPRDPDSDDGGTMDGPEVDFATNPRDGLDDPEDFDGDGLSDAAEILIHGTNSTDSDTDDGGVSDGEEVDNLTDPLDGLDDNDEGKPAAGEDGIYIVPANCDTCPCLATILNAADVVPGDTFFPVIGTFGEEPHIFSKGNEVTIENIP